ncbi:MULTISPECIES: TOMM precursor leader peptide-binding protein [unclassified Paenibacillus]|uniref:TOMM precursor leader peptide-binding protein n=1 Tax=unclassified Paenibacillus TaxID=185978 RepID=UPI00020D6DF6|nr:MULTISPECIES: TOMM precursor leader peptide-binding protein [unclassified Paenibacillus]EGL15244.1 bacteriocin biosynthesis cyclodehydratase domain protein [Paenibacillus sp. HGF7]EPD85980.1 SagD family bacteriocin biosynthesis docking scaffold [Paenibacillus sp. HGH0039]
MSAAVVIVGEGVLADCVCGELSTQFEVVRQSDFEAGVPEAADLVLVLNDAWNPYIHQKAEELLQPAGIPWLRGFVSFGEGVIGPLVRPGTRGCSQCADTRRLMAGRERKEMLGLQQRLMTRGGVERDAWASRTGLLQVGHLLAVEARKVLQGQTVHSAERVFLINLKTLESTLHLVLPDPLCPVCSQLLDDSSAAADISLQPSPKISADSYRCRGMDELNKVLTQDYLDYRTGFLNGKMVDLKSPFADVSVNLPLLAEDVGTAGRTHSYAVSELTAILEGLERYCGLAPRSKRTVIRDSYRNLKDQAFDPVKVGEHTREQYAQPGAPYTPFNPDHPIDWVWGYSFLQERPILVPEQLAYYSMGCGHSFVFETSNGCALGGSLEEAIFYGILEVVERDSFLMTWYAQLPLPRLDLYSANDQELQLMIDRLRAVAGFDVHFFNSTMENGIPSVWGVAKNRKQTGVNLICAAGAHPDPVRAVKSAVHELAGMVQSLDEKLDTNRETYVRMFHDSSLVQQMEDHSLLYGLPQAQERLQFLLDDNRPLRTFEEEFKREARHADLTDDLKDLLKAFHRLNLDVIVVDVTAPEIMRNGLHCVKVLIPGMLPMTFGHHFTRLAGLERVLRVPVELGYAEKPLRLEDLNPHPHPFP